MPLKLVRRSKSPYWHARGCVQGFGRCTFSLRTTDKAEAERRKAEIEAELYRPQRGDNVTFAIAAEHYAASRNLSDIDIQNIANLNAVIGDMNVTDVTQATLIQTADRIKKGKAAATRNRHVLTPAAAILHYAAKNDWCKHIEVSKLQEPPPKTRSVSDDVIDKLFAAVKGDEEKTLILLWMFRQGDRVSDILATRYDDCDLTARTLRRYIGKTRRTITVPLDDDICQILVQRVSNGADGRIFHWKYRFGVERWLRILCRKLDVVFTPHMARHTVGKKLSNSGASVRTIMDKLGHADVKSSMRYQNTEIDTLRKASNVLKVGYNRETTSHEPQKH